MKNIATTIWRHLKLFGSLWIFTLKSMLEYRLNFLLQLLYGPAYVLVLWLVLQTVYSKTPTLGGFTQQEGMLLFSVFQLLYMTFYLFFMKSFRYLMWSSIRLGEFDFILTKPISPQFFASIQKPYIEQLPLTLFLLGLFWYQVSLIPYQIPLQNWLGFIFLFIAGLIIAYYVVSSYCTTAFYATKAAQVIELFDKTADTAQYPHSIFPTSFRLLTATILPVAFFGYVPTLFLIGKGSGWLLGSAVLMVIVSYSSNKWLWKRGLEHYSSASS